MCVLLSTCGSRAADMVQQRFRKRTVPRIAVLCGFAGCCCESNERARRCVDGAETSQAYRSRARNQSLAEGIVPTRIQNKQRNPGPPGDAIQNAIQVDGFETNVTIRLDFSRRRNEQVLATHFHGMASIVKHTCFASLRHRSQIADRRFKRGSIRVNQRHYLESQAL